MSQLRELPDTRQIPGEPRRRWFWSPELDLIVWLGATDEPIGFQLCYDKLSRERALTWREGRGFDHTAVDSGESDVARYKRTPILVADGIFERQRVSAVFDEAAAEVPKAIRRYVADKLAGFPED